MDKLMIFIVDDNELFLTVIRKKLEMVTGAIVKSFPSGEACLKALEEKPDLVLTDYYLDSDYTKKMNGDKLLEHIKKTAPDTPVIIYSSQESIDLAVSMIRQGAIEYLPKDKNAIQRISLSVVKAIERIKNRYQEKERKKALYFFIAGAILSFSFFLLMDYFNPGYFPDFNYFIVLFISIVFGALLRGAYKLFHVLYGGRNIAG